MTETTAQVAQAKPMSLFARLVGVVTSPRETFTNVAAFPTWIGIALVIILVTAGTQLWFQSTGVGKQIMLDESIRQMESFGMKVNDAMYEQIRKGVMEPSAVRTTMSLVAMTVFPPVIWAILGGVLFLVFGVFTGGTATFKQVYAAVVHSSVVSTLGTLLVTPLSYLREARSTTNLGVFMGGLPEGSFFARLAGMIDVFVVWWLIVLSIGVAVTYKKKTGGTAAVLFGIYALIAIGIAAFQAVRSGS